MFFMKKITTMAYVAALALVSTAGLTSCSNDEPGTGNYNGEVVKTEFAIQLPSQVSGSSNTGVNRMPGIIVQQDLTDITKFQGMTDIQLIPFAKQGAIESSDARIGSLIDLTSKGNVTSADAQKNSHAKVYSDVSIPLSTASFLFYARSAADNTSNKFNAGSLVPDIDKTNPSAITFDLEPICTNYKMAAGETGGKLMQYLTNVATASDGTKHWYDITAVENPAFKALFDTLVAMNGLSSFEVERVMTDLGKTLRPLYSTSDMAKAIIDSIGSDYVIATTVTNDVLTLTGDYHTFPQSLDLPVGCIDITWDGKPNYKFKEGNYDNMANPASYVYPAQLWYYVNSTIKTSNTSKQTMYKNSSIDWDAILAAHTGAAYVNTLTRAVAIEDPIQYAVGRLDVDVKLNAESLADNSLAVVGAATAVDCSGGFPVTAVFVGGQKQVGFDFTPKGALDYTIYDSMMNSSTMEAVKGSLSAMNYTMVLETATSTDVNIAVEMVNTTGVDFYGVGGQLIPKGGRFYVVAQLSAASATETGNKVFKQDYITTAHLNLTSLKNAYSTIPDLRTPQLELGFSVDLTWQNGHEYTINID